MNITRHFIQLANGQHMHYRQAGGGRTLVMLHPSPLSSASLLPMINTLSPHIRTVAPDTPGYGDSDPLADTQSDSLAPYVDSLAQFIDVLGLESVLLYGSATGAQIAIEFSKAYPNRCEGLLLENVALFSDQERSDFMRHYFPDLSPKADGSHLTQAWAMVSRLFKAFPWYSDKPEDQLSAPQPTAEMLQQTLLDYLRAGEGYSRAYIAALNNERLEALVAIPNNINTRILIWQDSILSRLNPRFNDATLPPHIQCVEVAKGFDKRCEALTEHLLELQVLSADSA